MIPAGLLIPRPTPTAADLLAQLERTRDADAADRFARQIRERAS